MMLGRPRSTEVDAALASAVRDLLLRPNGSYEALNMDAIAATAGVGKAAIYRRWKSKAEMVFELVIHRRRLPTPPDSGSLAADLRHLVRRIVTALSSEMAWRALPGLVADVSSDAELLGRFTESFIDSETALIEEILRRAVRRKELAAVPDAKFVHAVLLGTVFASTFLVRSPMTARTEALLSDWVTTALGEPMSRKKKGRSNAIENR